MQKRALCLGAGGFIGSHLVRYLKDKGYWVRGVDIKYPEYDKTYADDFQQVDLRKPNPAIYSSIDEVYHLAANMGGISYIETHKARITHDNTLIDCNVLGDCITMNIKKIFYSSSACVYAGYRQNDTNALPLSEDMAYPADAEDGYGWQKLMTERMLRHFMEDFGLECHIARFHNIYGPKGTYMGGREKAPAALCRKIAQKSSGGTIEVWGNGEQTRSYCYIDDCVKGIYLLMQSDCNEPLNIGSDRLISVNDMIKLISGIAKKEIKCSYNLNAAQGVKGRNADLTKIREITGWEPTVTLEEGLGRLYKWVESQLFSARKDTQGLKL